jgi:hypothetical protein
LSADVYSFQEFLEHGGGQRFLRALAGGFRDEHVGHLGSVLPGLVLFDAGELRQVALTVPMEPDGRVPAGLQDRFECRPVVENWCPQPWNARFNCRQSRSLSSAVVDGSVL